MLYKLMPVIAHRSSHRADMAAASMKKTLAKSLRAEMARSNTSIQAIAKRLGTGRTSVRRILDESNTSITLSTISKAAAALGLVVVLEAKRLPPSELGRLASKLPGASASHAARIENEIVAGFYGRKVRA